MTGKNLDELFNKIPERYWSSKTEKIVNRFNRSEYYLPESLVEFIVEMLTGKSYEKCLDPWAQNGILLASVVYSEIVKKGFGICIDEHGFNSAQKIGENLDIQWEHADPWQWIKNNEEPYDLIISSLPWGMKTGKSSLEEQDFKDIHDNDELLFLLKACHLLKPEGIGIFIVPKNFINPDKNNSVYANLERFGFALDAYLAFPGQTFSPITSMSGGIAVIRKSEPIPIFTGFVQNDAEQRNQLTENFQKRRVSENILYGALIDPKDFRGFETVAYQDRISRISKKLGFPVHQLKDIVLEANLVKNDEVGFQELENSVFLPLIGTSPAVITAADFKIKPHNYIQLLIEPTKADANYIAGLFNSPYGRLLRDQGLSGTVIPKLTKKSIENITVFLPAISQQKILVEADRKIQAIENDIKSLRDQLWSNPKKLKNVLPKLERLTREESFEEWLDTLPYPLASILWTYHAAGKDEKSRYQHLQNFFEAAAIFFATILISGAKKDAELWNTKIPEILESLKKEKLSFEKSSFGTWSNTYSALAKEIRRIKEKDIESRERVYQIFGTHDPEVISLISSKELSSLFQDNNALRNKWKGHTGIVGDAEAKRRHELLKPHLQTIQKIIGSTLNHYHLIYPGRLDRLSDGYSQDILFVKGTRSRFLSAQIDLDEGLKKGYLYLIGDGERNGLELLPFVRLSSSPKEESNACYFYNSKEPDNYRFISYHFEPIPEIPVPFSDLLKAFNGLLNSSNQSPISNQGGE